MTEENHLSIPADASPMLMLDQAIKSGTPANDLEKLMDLVERWEDRQASKAFDQSVAEFQARCPIIKKDRKGHNYMFAGLDDIMRQIRPVLKECALTVSFTASVEGTDMTAVCRVSHAGHTREASVTLPMPKDMKVNDTQKMGAALSYAKRYSLCAALNITVSNEDDDAAGIEQVISTAQEMALREKLMDLPKEKQLEFLKIAQVHNLKDLPAERFAKAMEWLENA